MWEQVVVHERMSLPNILDNSWWEVMTTNGFVVYQQILEIAVVME